MAEVRKRAVKILQGRRTLFLAFFSVRDFCRENFYQVDRLDVHEGKGMQRLLNQTRAKSFGKDILGADKEDEAFLPTSVLLTTDGRVSYDEERKEIFFDTDPFAKICPFDVVDGQHRIEGLKVAAQKNERLWDFPVAAVIAHDMSFPEKMLQFVTINTKQLPVDKGVIQHAIARFTNMVGVEPLPYLPQWIRRQIEAGDDDRALRIAQRLNGEKDSPWYGRIRFASDDKRHPRHTILQVPFVKSIKRHLLAKNHPLPQLAPDEDKQIRILINYWTAVEKIFIAPNPITDAATKSVVFKSNGLEFFHSISAPIFNHLAKTRTYTSDAIEKCIESAHEHLPEDVIEVMSPVFWQTGNMASGMNAAYVGELAAKFSNALAQVSGDNVKL